MSCAKVALFVCLLAAGSATRAAELVLTVKPDAGRLTAFTSGGKRVRLELFLPRETGRRPAVLLLHGRGGLTRSREWLRAEGALLASNGYVGAVLHYFERTSGDPDREGTDPDRHDAWRATVSDAVTALQRQPFVDPGSIGLVGFSLGGALVIDVAARDARIGAVVEFFGWLNPATPVSALPPVLVLHGKKDDNVPVSRAAALVRQLRRAGRPHDVHIYPGEGHGFELPAMQDALSRMLLFFAKHLARR